MQGVDTLTRPMTTYVDLSDIWPDGFTIADAMKLTGLDRRTLSAAKRGQLDRSQYSTLVKIQGLASYWAGRTLPIEEFMKVGPQDGELYLD